MERDDSTVKAYVGVSGFSYSSWKGRFYPNDAKSEEFLTYYAGRLETVEINSSFYAPPSPAMVKNWSVKTGEGFKFSFKAPRLITHILKIGQGSLEASNKFYRVLDLLGPRKGPVLFQLPPFLKLDHDLLAGFLSETSDIKSKVFEFRHESWFKDSVYRLLEDNGAGFCIADTEDLEPTFRVTGGFPYFRLRKDSYDEKAIDEWHGKVMQAASCSSECYIYLRHDETGENALLAKRLSDKLKNSR